VKNPLDTEAYKDNKCITFFIIPIQLVNEHVCRRVAPLTEETKAPKDSRGPGSGGLLKS
jgi:hypothetical protein